MKVKVHLLTDGKEITYPGYKPVKTKLVQKKGTRDLCNKKKIVFPCCGYIEKPIKVNGVKVRKGKIILAEGELNDVRYIEHNITPQFVASALTFLL